MFVYIFLIFLITNIISTHAAKTLIDEQVIGIVNGENLYLNNFNRLFYAQKKKLKPEDRFQEESLKKKVVDLLIDELLVQEEAKTKNINIQEEEINERLNLIKQKSGSEDAFNKFLIKNNATTEDAKNEIKTQLLFEVMKTQIPSFKTFLAEKRRNANIVIYNYKIFSEAGELDKEIATCKETFLRQIELVSLQPLSDEYEGVTGRAGDGGWGEGKGEIDSHIKLRKDIVIEEIKEPLVLKPIIQDETKNPVIQDSTMINLSKEIEELRRSIEQRRVTLENKL